MSSKKHRSKLKRYHSSIKGDIREVVFTHPTLGVGSLKNLTTPTESFCKTVSEFSNIFKEAGLEIEKLSKSFDNNLKSLGHHINL